MQDMQTQSLWSQISGECIQGKLEGTRLTLFPASQTTFAEFKRIYPNGVLLKKPEKGPEGSQYESYFADSTKMGIFGRVESFERLGADQLCAVRQYPGGITCYTGSSTIIFLLLFSLIF